MESRNIFAIKQGGRDERGRDPRHSAQSRDNSRTLMQWSAPQRRFQQRDALGPSPPPTTPRSTPRRLAGPELGCSGTIGIPSSSKAQPPIFTRGRLQGAAGPALRKIWGLPAAPNLAVTLLVVRATPHGELGGV